MINNLNLIIVHVYQDRVKCNVKPTHTGNCSLNKQGQCKFIGHVMRGERMENLETTGKIQGKRDSYTKRKDP
jgi:hypothetical protein